MRLPIRAAVNLSVPEQRMHPEYEQRHEGRDRKIADEVDQRFQGRLHETERSHQQAERHGDGGGNREAEQHDLDAGADMLGQRAVAGQPEERLDHGAEPTRAGLSIELEGEFKPGETLLDNRTPDGRGICVRVAANNAIEISVSDGRSESRWSSDPGPAPAHHAIAVIDGGPHVISFITDGKFNDGGDARQFGWGRFNPYLQSVAGAPEFTVAPSVKHVRIYNRALRTSESVTATSH